MTFHTDKIGKQVRVRGEGRKWDPCSPLLQVEIGWYSDFRKEFGFT